MLQSLEDLVESMKSGPRAQRLIGSLSLSVEFRVADTGEQCYLAIQARQATAGKGKHPKAAVIVEGTSRDLEKVLSGSRDITHFISEGKIRLRGDYYQAIDLSRLALAARQPRAGG